MKKMSRLCLLFFSCLLLLSISTPVFASPEGDRNGVVVQETTTDVDRIYERYKDNSFELMTKEMPKESLTGFKETLTNATGTMKNMVWGMMKGIGQFNAEMVKFLFTLDVITPIKEPVQQLTASIASNMLSIAGSIGIGFVTLIMGIKFIGEQRFRKAFRVFGMTILIFTGLSVCKDATTSDSLFHQMFEADKQIEAAFVKVNPVLNGESVPESKDGNVDDRMKSAGELMASRIFYTNVYEPYLLMNYGSSVPESIRKKSVEYKGESYDRIQILLDNDVNQGKNIELHEEVTKYEAEELNNRTVQYFKNLDNMFYGCFYLIVNLIQTVVYFLFCFIRLIIAVMQVFLLPLLPILLLVGLFMTEMNVFANYFKAFGITIFMKGMMGFACVFFATFLSLGFQLSNKVSNPWQKILTMLVYLFMPFGLYIFRRFLGSLFTGRVSLAEAMAFATHPFSTEKKLRTAAKEREKENKLRRKTAQEERKDALRKRQEEAQKQGKTELGLKQQPVKEREAKRSVLRRELNQKAQHKAPNRVEKAQQNLQNLHEKGRQQELKEHQQLARQRQRERYDKENLKTAATLVAANQHLRKGTPLADSKSDPMENPQGTQIRQSNRRIGQSRKGRVDGQRSTARRQGQKQVPAKTEGTQTGIKQRQATNNRSVARSQHRTSGKKPIKPTTTPNANSQLRGRSLNGAGGSPLRQKASVRQKMQAVQQVIHQQAPKSQPTEQRETPTIAPPITRIAKRNVPPIKAKKARSRIAVRRTLKTKTKHLSARNQTKGMRQPRARK
ncbi:CD3337/EF1877 family mobilome membrane protein [Enterococcus gallinarum]|uniref:CD3337/EF1877 family mobilome membrane protein n=1 Tax=Enterococcus gallinarum TaxID=1353 RepID=UPI003BF8A38A